VTVKQDKNGKWLVQVDRLGVPRVRKSFPDRITAESFEREYLARYATKINANADQRCLKELVELWFIYHGMNLADGERRRVCLLDIATALKNPIASRLTAEDFVKYRAARLRAGLSQKTFNNHHGYFSSLFNKLRKLKVIDYENPIAEVDFIKIQERQLSYLSVEQIQILMDTISSGCDNESTYYVAQLCLRTGARWGEAEQLRFKQLHAGRVTFEFTKGKKTRTIPLSDDFYGELMKFASYKNPDDRVFTNCIGSFRRAVGRTDLDLPKGQCSHILRHSFASHFMMNGGNILSLQKILGHADISMTMRYAHLSPDHLQDAIKLNPMINVDAGSIPD
jgi:integrase